MPDSNFTCRQPSPEEKSYRTGDAFLSSLPTNPEERVALARRDGRPIALDLAPLDPKYQEGVCTAQFIRQLHPKARGELEGLQQDLYEADGDKDRYLTKEEIYDYAEVHPDRHRYPVLFHSEADHLLNILPFYASRPELSAEEEDRLEKVRGYYSEAWRESGLDPSKNPIGIYGIPLGHQTPVEERSPEWFAGAMILLNLQRDDEGLSVGGGYTPFTPNGNGIIRRLNPLGNISGIDILDGLFGGETAQWALLGQLTPGETIYLRKLIAENDTPLDALLRGAKTPFRRLGQEIAKHPVEFAAMNAAFIGATWLYRREANMRKIFQEMMASRCRGPVASERVSKAWDLYQRGRVLKMGTDPALQRLLKRGADHPLTQLLLFNLLASFKQEGQKKLQERLVERGILTEGFSKELEGNFTFNLATDLLVLIPLLEGIDRLGDYGMEKFLNENGQFCGGPANGPQVEPLRAPVPVAAERVAAALTTAALATGKFVSDNAEGIGWALLGVGAAVATGILIFDDATGIGVVDDPALAATAPATAGFFARSGAAFAAAW